MAPSQVENTAPRGGENEVHAQKKAGMFSANTTNIDEGKNEGPFPLKDFEKLASL